MSVIRETPTATFQYLLDLMSKNKDEYKRSFFKRQN